MYQTTAVYDRYGRQVGYLDGPFVLTREYRVAARVESGIVLLLDGRIPGSFDGTHFLDRTGAVVAATRRTIRVPLHSLRALTEVIARPLQAPRPAWERDGIRLQWSRVDWAQYVAF